MVSRVQALGRPIGPTGHEAAEQTLNPGSHDEPGIRDATMA